MFFCILGGVGKTTTAANIAYGLAERGYKTVVIDFGAFAARFKTPESVKYNLILTNY
jgi:MinD-like ATPase involved in chromosome partitioning or flagellar assembly